MLEVDLQNPTLNLGAVLIELINARNGLFFYSFSFLRGLRDLCDHYLIPIIVDEVITGNFRTGPKFAFLWYLWCGFVPDYIVVGKGSMFAAICAVDRIRCNELKEIPEFSNYFYVPPRGFSSLTSPSSSCRYSISPLPQPNLCLSMGEKTLHAFQQMWKDTTYLYPFPAALANGIRVYQYLHSLICSSLDNYQRFFRKSRDFLLALRKSVYPFPSAHAFNPVLDCARGFGFIFQGSFWIRPEVLDILHLIEINVRSLLLKGAPLCKSMPAFVRLLPALDCDLPRVITQLEEAVSLSASDPDNIHNHNHCFFSGSGCVLELKNSPRLRSHAPNRRSVIALSRCCCIAPYAHEASIRNVSDEWPRLQKIPSSALSILLRHFVYSLLPTSLHLLN